MAYRVVKAVAMAPSAAARYGGGRGRRFPITVSTDW